MVILGGMRPDGSTSRRVVRAVEVTAMHHVANDRTDVVQRLRAELAARGVTEVDQEWVERVAAQIRAEEPVDFR